MPPTRSRHAPTPTPSTRQFFFIPCVTPHPNASKGKPVLHASVYVRVPGSVWPYAAGDLVQVRIEHEDVDRVMALEAAAVAWSGGAGFSAPFGLGTTKEEYSTNSEVGYFYRAAGTVDVSPTRAAASRDPPV